MCLKYFLVSYIHQRIELDTYINFQQFPPSTCLLPYKVQRLSRVNHCTANTSLQLGGTISVDFMGLERVCTIRSTTANNRTDRVCATHPTVSTDDDGPSSVSVSDPGHPIVPNDNHTWTVRRSSSRSRQMDFCRLFAQFYSAAGWSTPLSTDYHQASRSRDDMAIGYLVFRLRTAVQQQLVAIAISYRWAFLFDVCVMGRVTARV